MTTTAVRIRPKLSGDRKVSPVVRRQTHKDAPAISNSYGLPAGDSCPGRTPFCDACYAAKLENAYASSGRLVRHNYDLHLDAGDDPFAHAAIVRLALDEYRMQFDRAFAAGRVAEADDVFRIHWDGDLFSEAYTLGWRWVIDDHPSTRFWIYTRSFDWAHLLVDAPNISVYLSVDEHNIHHASPLLAGDARLHAAFCASTQAEAAALADSLGRTAVPCPENVGRIPLVMPQSNRRTDAVAIGEDGRGACVACGLCIFGRQDVAFATTHR